MVLGPAAVRVIHSVPLLRGAAPVDAAPSLEGCSHTEPRASWIVEACGTTHRYHCALR